MRASFRAGSGAVPGRCAEAGRSVLDHPVGDLPHRQPQVHRGLLDPRNASVSLRPSCSCSTPLARSTAFRVASDSCRSLTSRSSSVISVNRLTAISMAGTRSPLWNGLTRYAIAPASRARATRSRWEKAVRITTGAIRSPAMVSAAAMPSSTGIFTSRITRSGRSSRASSIAF